MNSSPLSFAGKLLLQNIQNRSCTKNLLLSPLSFNAIAAMLAAGCSGPTQDRILGFLGSKSLDSLKSEFSGLMSIATSCGPRDPKISFANGVWVDERIPLKPSYHQCVTEYFKSQAKNVNFHQKCDEALEEINWWAETHSKGLIQKVLQPKHVTPLTTLILGNAIYFKGYWADKFDHRRVQERTFYLLNGDEINSVPFMTSSISYPYGSFDGFKVLEIPYQTSMESNKSFSMQLILPNEKDGLRNLLDKLNTADSGFLNQHFKLKETALDDFWIPKFKFSYTLDNIKFPFMGDRIFDQLTEMVDLENGYPLEMTSIIQKAFIEVDEEGTEAAAVTFAHTIAGCCGYQEVKSENFVADHPFLFIIKEETSGSVLFTGALLNPLQD